MRAVILSLALAAAAIAQPIPPPAAIIKGDPPGGPGGACTPASMIGYLSNAGALYTCPSGTSVWTAVSGSGFVNSPSWTITTSAVTPPAAPTVTTHGAAGSTTYGYKVTFRLPNGSTAASAERTITNGNAVLDGTNYNIITAPACTMPGETADVYITTAGGNVPDVGWLANIACGGSFNHQGQDGDYSELAPSTDSSTGAYTTHNLGVSSVGLFGNLARANPHGNIVSISVGQHTTVASPIDFREQAVSAENMADTSAIDGTSLEGTASVATWMGQSPLSTGATLSGQLNYAQVGDGLRTGNPADGTNIHLQGGLNMALVSAATGTTVPTARGVVGGVDVYSGTVTEAAALLAHNGTSSSHTVNRYGLLIEGVTGADNNYAIKTGAGSVDFASATNVRLPSDATGTTQSPGDNSTKVATTAYVDAAGGGGTAAPPYLTIGGTPYGPFLAITKPPASSWTWVNQGSGTATATNGAITLVWPHTGGDAVRAYMQAVPSSSAFTASIGFLTASPNAGICVSDGTKLTSLFLVNGSTYHYDTWNNTTSNNSSTTLAAGYAGTIAFMRMILSSGTYTTYASADGLNWNTVRVDSSGFMGTPTLVGPCAYVGPSGASYDVVSTLVHFTSSTP